MYLMKVEHESALTKSLRTVGEFSLNHTFSFPNNNVKSRSISLLPLGFVYCDIKVEEKGQLCQLCQCEVGSGSNSRLLLPKIVETVD
jgi:hypothetical protein